MTLTIDSGRSFPGRRKPGRLVYYATSEEAGHVEFVICSKCGHRFGDVYEQDDGTRSFTFRHGFRPDDKGFWRLTRHAAERLRRGRKPSARRYSKPPHLAGRVVETSFSPLRFPVTVQCPECRRMNVLDGAKLNLQDQSLDPKRAFIESSPAGDYIGVNRVIHDPRISDPALLESLRRAWARGEQTPANLTGMRRSKPQRRTPGKWPKADSSTAPSTPVGDKQDTLP